MVLIIVVHILLVTTHQVRRQILPESKTKAEMSCPKAGNFSPSSLSAQLENMSVNILSIKATPKTFLLISYSVEGAASLQATIVSEPKIGCEFQEPCRQRMLFHKVSNGSELQRSVANSWPRKIHLLPFSGAVM